MWEPQISSQSVRSTGENLDFQLTCEVRGVTQSCGTEFLTCGVCTKPMLFKSELLGVENPYNWCHLLV